MYGYFFMLPYQSFTKRYLVKAFKNWAYIYRYYPHIFPPFGKKKDFIYITGSRQAILAGRHIRQTYVRTMLYRLIDNVLPILGEGTLSRQGKPWSD